MDHHHDIEALKKRYFHANFSPTENAALHASGKPVVSLWTLQQPMLIVPAASQIVYYSQVGGHSCRQVALEGFLVPIEPIEPMAAVFNPQEWGGAAKQTWYWWHTPEDIAEIERQFMELLRVVPDEDNCEAWLWCRVTLENDEEESLCVLTWANSD